MSIELMSRVWKSKLETSGELIILLALADHAHDDGSRIFPAIAHTAWKTNYSERQVQRMIASFVEKGILVLVKKAYASHPNEYCLDISKLEPKEPYRSEGGDILSPLPSVTPLTPQGGDTHDTPRGDTHVTPGVTHMSPKPLINHQLNQTLLANANEDEKKEENTNSTLPNDSDNEKNIEKQEGTSSTKKKRTRKVEAKGDNAYHMASNSRPHALGALLCELNGVQWDDVPSKETERFLLVPLKHLSNEEFTALYEYVRTTSFECNKGAKPTSHHLRKYYPEWKAHIKGTDRTAIARRLARKAEYEKVCEAENQWVMKKNALTKRVELFAESRPDLAHNVQAQLDEHIATKPVSVRDWIKETGYQHDSSLTYAR